MKDHLSDSPDEAIAPLAFQRAHPADVRKPRHLPLGALAVGLTLLLLSVLAAFIFLAHPVLILVTPPPDSLRLSGGPSFALGKRFLLLRGAYRLQAELAGHHALDILFQVPVADDTLRAELRRLPGRLQLQLEPDVAAEVRVDGTLIGRHPETDLLVEPGQHIISVHPARWLAASRPVQVEGMGRPFLLTFKLLPAWADVQVSSEPPGAEIYLDGQPLSLVTPAQVEMLASARMLSLHLEGYQPARTRLALNPSEQISLPTLKLQRITGDVQVRSVPKGASVTVNNSFQGRTPLVLALSSEGTHQIDLFKAGYQAAQRRIQVDPGTTTQLDIPLIPSVGELRVQVGPQGARLRVDGEERGSSNQVLELSAEEHEIEIYLDGYQPYRTRIMLRPEFVQAITATLKTIEQARREAMTPEIIAANGQKFVLIQPEEPFSMGASRREPGRRANEVLRQVTITRPYYIAITELTNAQYRAFDAGYDSTAFEKYDLDGDRQPVVNISWDAAARYCNWLSLQDGLRPVYRIRQDQVRGFDESANGYRLPTEAEWSYVTRVQANGELWHFPWGHERHPPEDRLGNYADRTAESFLPHSIPGYTDGHIVTADVASYGPNHFGLHDLGGNVAEWINDFYAATSVELQSDQLDPLGPPGGEYHVIRGASWMHGQIIELRLTFRDYGREGRPDVGLRLVRWFE